MNEAGPSIEDDVAAIARIDVVPTILDVVCRTTGMGFAAVARVTEDRWVACAVKDNIAFGLLPGGDLKVETTICNEIRTSGRPVVIDHVAQDAVFRQHRTPAIYGFQSYISVPIVRADGKFFGTLCAIDPRPMSLDRPETRGMFELFAQLIAFHLDAHEQLEASEAALLNERQRGRLRERFIAELGHDLRNPIAAMGAGIRLLRGQPQNDKSLTMLDLMQGTVARMSGLVDNVLDFARGRFGGGIELLRDQSEPLQPTLRQVIEELRMTSPGRVIEAELAIVAPVRCDRSRIAQLFSNLLSNALAHGTPDAPIRVRAFTENGMLVLSVANSGEPIPPGLQKRLFQPFFRSSARYGHKGLGLGLYIAAEIARAHGGTLDVTSSTAETRFTLRMPVG